MRILVHVSQTRIYVYAELDTTFPLIIKKNESCKTKECQAVKAIVSGAMVSIEMEDIIDGSR